jgi:hypothetical protein
MGRQKAELERREALYDQVTQILISAEAISPCDECEDENLSNEDEDALKKAYAIGTNMLKSGSIVLDRASLMNMIHNQFWETPSRCPTCDRLANKAVVSILMVKVTIEVSWFRL